MVALALASKGAGALQLRPFSSSSSIAGAACQRSRPSPLIPRGGSGRSWGLSRLLGRDGDGDGDGGPKPTPLEKMIRKATGNQDYRFGDLTRGTLREAKGAAEGVVREVTGKEDYELGDLTRGTLRGAKGAAEGVGREVTGKEDYELGDLTRGAVSEVAKRSTAVLTYGEGALGLIREANIHEIVELSRYFWTRSMTDAQRRETFVVFVSLGAIIVLAYNFLANINGALISVAAWTATAARLGASPLAAAGAPPALSASFLSAVAGTEGWTSFLRTRDALGMLLYGPLLPVRVAALIPFFFTYRRWMVAWERRGRLAERYPIVSRVLTLLGMFVTVNCVLVGAAAVGLAWLSSLATGVPLA